MTTVEKQNNMVELKTILYAEDNPYDVELTLEALTDHNLVNNVVHVKDGVEVMEFLHCEGKYKGRKPGNPAVLMLDIKMPRMDGLEVLRAIRSDSTLKTIPVVILTSSREEQDLFQSYALGVNAYVVKPVEFKNFVEAVRQIGVFWGLINELPPNLVK